MSFAVGSAGRIQYFDGTSWSTMSSGTTRDLTAVWGSNPDDVFAVGDSIVDHWDGTEQLDCSYLRDGRQPLWDLARRRLERRVGGFR